MPEIDITVEGIIKLLNNLDVSKAAGPDNIPNRILKLTAKQIAPVLQFIFKQSYDQGLLPEDWRKANVAAIYKKGVKTDPANYRPISLLPIFSKIFEKIIFDSMYGFLVENELISKHQSGFRPGDSTINQLLAITDEIFQSFENNAETRAAFLDISKAFDKVWHEGLLFKLKRSGITGNLHSLICDFLSDRSQRVVLNGMESPWLPIESGVPQGSVLGPLLFLVY